MKFYNADCVFDGTRLISPGSVVVREGVIQEIVPRKVDSPDSEYIGSFITPGLVDAHTHCGVASEGIAIMESDVNEFTNPLTPELLASDSLNYRDYSFARALRGGVTRIVVLPGSSNVIGGQGCVVGVSPTTCKVKVLSDPACIKVAISKGFYGRKGKAPATRMAVFSMLRDAFGEVQRRLPRSRASAQTTNPDVVSEADGVSDAKSNGITFQPDGVSVTMPTGNLYNGQLSERGVKSLARALNRDVPVRVHLMTASEILSTLKLAQEFSLRIVLDHATEAHFVIDEILEHDVPVVYGPLLVPRDGPGRKWRMAEVAAYLVKKGVTLALMTDHPVIPVDALRLDAGLLVREGVSPEKALAAVTSIPAAIAGLKDGAGSLTPGKMAEFVGWTDQPWQPWARITKYVAGQA